MKKEMNDFTILHLSDLHINKSGEKLPLLLENLLLDIEQEMKVVNNIIIVVTGDLVHKGNYQSKESVLTFFKKLKEKIGKKVRDIYIVPGNHDKTRNKLDEKILKTYKFSESTEDFYQNYWKYIKINFSEYTELVEKIYSIFLTKSEVRKKLKEDTYGVAVTTINKKRICFLLFNTAWASRDSRDERRLKVGKFQLDKIQQEYENGKKEGGYDLTIALAHHPLNWLSGKEETEAQSRILSNYRLDCDVYISGHIHNRDVINWQSTRHSLTTLVSGLGWPDEEEDAQHPYAHTYSSYTFNLDINSIDVYVRSSDDNSTFEPDFRIYRNKRDKENRKMVMPIDSHKTQAFFPLGAAQGRTPKACYITEDILEWIQRYTQVIGKFRSDMYMCLEQNKWDFLDQYFEIGERNPQDGMDETAIEEVNDFFFGGVELSEDKTKYFCDTEIKERMYELFDSYLGKICILLSELIEAEQRDQCGRENTDCIVRTHFRYLNEENDGYSQLCIGAEEFVNYKMEDKKWGELLQETYKAKSPLIASVNREYCEESYINNSKKKESNSQKRWIDFLTLIPQIEGNDNITRNERTGEVIDEKPLITFGITIYDEFDRILLYVLDYLKIDKVISSCIQEFRYYMPVDIKEFISYVNMREWEE